MQNSPELQNAQYTFKQNTSLGRHGWLRLTPAYSVQLVNEVLEELDYTPTCVLEPFSGTGTTELVCANRGISSIALEINPFLVWLGNAKLMIYTDKMIDDFKTKAYNITSRISNTTPSHLPSIHNIFRWWSEKKVDYLARLKAEVSAVTDKEVQQLLYIAFCRMVIDLSNAAFNHVSTSFKEDTNEYFSFEEGNELFLATCDMIAKTAKIQPIANSTVVNHDSRQIPIELNNTYDTVITSPPYPNRISYIRELRPYMYWMDYLNSSEQASSLDWATIGGTWGKATSMLSTWVSNGVLPKYVYEIAEKISNADNKSAKLMANYVLKYFEDMYAHLSSIYAGLMDNGKVFYIIGNSNFYGVTVPAERIYVDMMREIGFRNVDYKIVRKRNCKKQLYEFLVHADK